MTSRELVSPYSGTPSAYSAPNSRGSESAGGGGKGGQDTRGGQATSGGGVPGSVTPANFDVSQFGKSLGAGMQNAFEGGNQVFDKPLYAGMGAQTNAGLGALTQAAQSAAGFDPAAYLRQNPDVAAAGMDPYQHYTTYGKNEGRSPGGTSMFGAATDYTKNLVNTGGLTPEMRQALSTMGNVGNGYGSIADAGGLTNGMRSGITGAGDVAGNYDSLFKGAGAPSLTEQNMMSVANGGLLNGGNPYFEANLAKAKDNTYADVMASLGSSGRTGSSIHTDNLTGALGTLENSARGAQYETERDRQMQALAAIEAQRQQAFGNQNAALQGRLGAIGQQFGMENTGIGNRMSALSGQAGAAGQQFAGQQQGISNAMGATAALPGLYEAALMPGQTMLQAGQVRDADAQAKLMADYDLFSRKDPYSHLAKYAGLLNGSQQTSGIEEETPWWQSLLGGAVGLAGAFL